MCIIIKNCTTLFSLLVVIINFNQNKIKLKNIIIYYIYYT